MREGLTLMAYMTQVFATVQWGTWLLIMVGYSLFYFGIDTLVVSRALNWFITDIRYRDILPVRASAYIVSLFNEQVGKGGMAWYLHRRHQVPGWEVGSVMLFIMFCEVFYLLVWASVGYAFGSDELPAAFSLIPWLALRCFVLSFGSRFSAASCCPTIPCGINRFFMPFVRPDPGITSPFSCCGHRRYWPRWRFIPQHSIFLALKPAC